MEMLRFRRSLGTKNIKKFLVVLSPRTTLCNLPGHFHDLPRNKGIIFPRVPLSHIGKLLQKEFGQIFRC